MSLFSKTFGVFLASLLGFQSSLAFCICHRGENHQPKFALSHATTHEEEHPCHTNPGNEEPPDTQSDLKTGTNKSTENHESEHGCCCIRKDDSAVKSETCTLCFQKGKFSSVALRAGSVGEVFFGVPLLGKYCQAHAPPYETPLYLSLKTLRI